MGILFYLYSMAVPPKKSQATDTTAHKKTVRRKIAHIKLEFDKELEVLSGTILFPEKLAIANKFLLKAK